MILSVKKSNQRAHPSKMHSQLFFVCFFPPTYATTRTSKDKTRFDTLEKEPCTQSTSRPWRIIKVPSVPLSHPVFLSAPCSSSSSTFFSFCTTASVQALRGCLITLMHAHAKPRSGDASFSFRSCRQRLPRRARTHCKVMLKYFRRKCSQYSRTGLSPVWLRHKIPKPIFFVFEKKDSEALMRGLHKRS